MITPQFPLIEDPGTWPQLTLLAATILLEAEGEPFDGQVGVGWVVRRRALDWGQGWLGAILGKDQQAYEDSRPFEAFSAWNDDYRIRARARLSDASEEARLNAWKAASGVFWDFIQDPVGGSSFYLRKDTTLRIRKGSLPPWASTDKETITIGHHTFYRA
jgi:spore germination cell wall hydrolase CwlJ-like protein